MKYYVLTIFLVLSSFAIAQPAQTEPILAEQLIAPPAPPATPIMIVQEPKNTSWITKTALTAALLAILAFILERRPRKPETQLTHKMDDTWEYIP